LTASDLAFDLATAGFGKFKRIGEKAGELIQKIKTGSMSNRAQDVSEEVKDRIMEARAAKLTPATCSFHGDTLVKTSKGLLAISGLSVGDQVWARDEVSGQIGFKSILAQYSNPYEETVSVTVQDSDSGKVQTIVSNRIHPYFVQLPETANAVASSEGHVYQGEISNGAWIDAGNLKAGYRLLNDNNTWAEVVAIKLEAKALKAFNLTVADYHTYFVAANDEADAVWVHNKCVKTYEVGEEIPWPIDKPKTQSWNPVPVDSDKVVRVTRVDGGIRMEMKPSEGLRNRYNLTGDQTISVKYDFDGYPDFSSVKLEPSGTNFTAIATNSKVSIEYTPSSVPNAHTKDYIKGNEALAAINPDLAKDVGAIKPNGDIRQAAPTARGADNEKLYTWHHLEDGNSMVLVDYHIHNIFKHSGGRSITP
jgi:hypothetical protein